MDMIIYKIFGKLENFLYIERKLLYYVNIFLSAYSIILIYFDYVGRFSFECIEFST